MYRSKIVIASGDAGLRERLKAILVKDGYQVTGELDTAASVLRSVRALLPDLLIVDLDLGGSNAMELVQVIAEDRIAPLMLLTSHWQRNMVSQVANSWVMAVLVKPVVETNLLAALETALSTFRRLSKLETEIGQLRDTLESRKVVEKAKGLLMQHLGLTEAQAFRRLQQQSMAKGKSMRAIAEAVILAYEIQI